MSNAFPGCRPDGYGGDGNLRAETVIGEAGRNAERFRQVRDSPQIHLLGGAGYALVHLSSAISIAPSARAVATASSISASVAIPVERINGLPVRATVPDQRQIHQLEGSDLVCADPQGFQKIDRRIVEWA